ncbi:MAG: single-stranded-DNA-specific exonuclease RecJ [Firmicutes bacterium]|nr:single-stranded-DNA-specific exonuclease RecJ [Bacillota bacterium]
MLENESIIKLADKDYSIVDNLCDKLDISKLTAKVMINRGISNYKDCKEFLNPTLDNLYDPYLLKDMDKAVKRIIKGIKNKENIWVYGDYDVDGVTSTSLLKLFFSDIGYDLNYYIPDRFTEGYGLNKKAIENINENKGDLIITVDCGITSVEEVKHLKDLGMDIIITDHHTCQETLPNAEAVINPHREDDNYPFKNLAGVGVAFKLIEALSKKLDKKLNYRNFLPIVAMGTVADVVSLKGENRIIVKNGLKYINNTDNLGLQALLKITELKDKKITSGHIGFVLGPRLNATGRMSSAKHGVELLTTCDKIKALELAENLDDENNKRREIENEIFNEAEEIIEKEIDIENEKILVIASENWHHGVIGIVSSRITEKYHKPSVLISIDGSEGRASARSISTFDLFKGLNKCKELFIKFGGHKQAAGLSIEKEKIKIFRKEINEIADNVLKEEDLLPEIKVDSILETEDLNLKTVKELKTLEPFGMGNPSPVFLVRDTKITEIRPVGKENKHLKLKINKNGQTIDCIGFNLGHASNIIDKNKSVDIIGSLDINEFMGKKNLQIVVKDFKQNYISTFELSKKYETKLKDSIMTENKVIDSFNIKNLNIIKTDNRKILVKNTLKKQSKNLIIINNYKNALELLKELEFMGREFFKSIEISYNEVKNNKENLILVNPIITRDLKLNDFKNVIVYDMFFDISNLFKLMDIVNKDKVRLLINEDDFKLNDEILNSNLPTKDELRCIYKSLKTGNEIFKLNMKNYLKYINKTSNYTFNKIKIDLALDIFKEGNLIKLKKDDKTNYFIKLNKIKKVNIDNLPTFKRIDKLYENLKSYKNIINL